MIIHPSQLDAILRGLSDQALADRDGHFVDLRYRGEPNLFEFSEAFDLRAFYSRERNDRIVPVGFQDFAMCPREHRGNTRLSILTALHEGLRRVQNHSNPPAWMGWGEMEHETAWRAFVQSFTATSKPPRPDLDPEAYALEVEEAAYGAANLHTATSNYLNAFVRDYETVNRVRGSVFLFGFEDMHLNPIADHAIREAIRGLAHPRLAFLFARSVEENVPWPPPRYEPDREARNARIQAENEASRNRPPPLSPLARALLDEDPFG